MPTVHRAFGLRFVIFTDDHEPAHVHVIGNGGEANIRLGADGEGPILAWARGFNRADLSRAMAETALMQDRLWAAWLRIHEEDPR